MDLLASLIELILTIAIVGCAYGFYRTWKTGQCPDYASFFGGTAPSAMPEGLWNGTADELGKISWKGKKFLGGGRGINLFEKSGVTNEAYPFAFLTADSIGFPGKKILKLDYGQKENPLWLRFIVDEMVSVGENKFLGVVYITLIPGTPFRMGYFALTKGNPPGFLS